MPTLGPLEILVILVIALLVFGPNKLPELARQVGKGMSEFRRVQHHLRRELDDAMHSVMDEDTTQPRGTPPSTSPGDALDVDASAVDGPAPPAAELPEGATPDVVEAEGSSSEPADPDAR